MHSIIFVNYKKLIGIYATWGAKFNRLSLAIVDESILTLSQFFFILIKINAFLFQTSYICTWEFVSWWIYKFYSH